MNMQLRLVFDPEELKLIKSISGSVYQRAIIKGLAELYVEFIQLENSEESKDDKDN